MAIEIEFKAVLKPVQNRILKILNGAFFVNLNFKRNKFIIIH